MVHILRRAWFFIGLGGGLSSVLAIVMTDATASGVMLVYLIFCGIGIANGLWHVVFFGWNPTQPFEDDE